MPRLLAILAAVFTLALAASAHAEEPVTNTNDSGPGSLRRAVDTAVATDVIEVPPGTYRLSSGQLVIDVDAVRLTGTGGAAATIIESTGSFRVFCVTGPNDVVIERVTVRAGRAAPGTGGCANSQGGGINSEANILDVLNSVIEQNSATPDSGGGGGIFASGDLFVRDSIVRDNSTTLQSSLLSGNGGGGIRWAGSGTSFEITDSTVSGNTATVRGTSSGGGGIYSAGPPTVENVTFSGNRHLAGDPATGGGGGAILTATATGTVTHATFVANHSDRSGGALAGPATDLQNSLLHQNTAQTNTDCAPGSAVSLGGNLTNAVNQTCDFDSNDLANADPELGPLAVNGSKNGTLTHELLSRQSDGVELGQNCVSPEDQRGVSRFVVCDSGAYEFDGRASASIPDCSPTGVIPLALDEPPGGDVMGLSYMIDGGVKIEPAVTDVGDPPSPTSVSIPEGRRTLEYWGRWTNGEEQGHGLSNVLVDKTQPSVDVQNDQPRSIFVITRRATVDVDAADALSGLVQNPSADDVPLNTGKRGAATFSSTASDLCTNQATDSLNYQVLAPGLGVRTVLERSSGRVRVRPASSGAGAQASQKGQSFTPLTEPRELPVGSLIDTRAGTARLTTARTRREDQIQDGRFAAGVFQVLQSRRTRARGLTEVRLKGGNFARCARLGKARAGGPGAAALPRRIVRRLRGNARGRFRTRGRHSAATVRGTVWEVIDRCDGTLTKVKRGSVAVRDFRRKRTVIVRAGKSYLARAPR